MNDFYVWFAESKTASYLRAFVAIILYQGISEFVRVGHIDFSQWQQWVITGLSAFLPLLLRKANPEDALN